MQEVEFGDINHINGFFTFLWSIDWRDPWLIGLLTFHVAIFMMTTLTKNHGNFQAFLFYFYMELWSIHYSTIVHLESQEDAWRLKSLPHFDGRGATDEFLEERNICSALPSVLLVYFSESINRIASTNWKMFSRQQYFDSNGLFISIVFSMPILLNCMLLVGSWLYHSTQLMTNLKVAQLKERLKKQKLEEQEKQKLKDE